jgi:NADPH:quinone reductase-like Zn-dependent oxidoreductase
MLCPKDTLEEIKAKKDAKHADRKGKANPTSGTEIRKVWISGYGDETHVAVIKDTIPEPAANEVQVQVLYSGFSGADVNMRLGKYPFQKPAPFTPGYCLVGNVVANGSRSTKYQIGDTVCCLSIYDAEAELANLPEVHVHPVPEGIDLQAATALVVDWTTAYGMAMHTASIEPGNRVFIHGISSAVGWATATLCSLQGAEVYGTASPKNHAAVTAGLPGTKAFDYANKDWIEAMTSLGGAHVVFDPLGFESWDESYSILAPKYSMLIGFGGNISNLQGGEAKSMVTPVAKLFARNYLKVWEGRKTRFYYITRDDKTYVSDLEALFGLVQQGKVKVPIKRVFRMRDSEDIREAHRSWGKGQGVGSLLVKVKEDET